MLLCHVNKVVYTSYIRVITGKVCYVNVGTLKYVVLRCSVKNMSEDHVIGVQL